MSEKSISTPAEDYSRILDARATLYLRGILDPTATAQERFENAMSLITTAVVMEEPSATACSNAWYEPVKNIIDQKVSELDEFEKQKLTAVKMLNSLNPRDVRQMGRLASSFLGDKRKQERPETMLIELATDAVIPTTTLN